MQRYSYQNICSSTPFPMLYLSPGHHILNKIYYLYFQELLLFTSNTAYSISYPNCPSVIFYAHLQTTSLKLIKLPQKVKHSMVRNPQVIVQWHWFIFSKNVFNLPLFLPVVPLIILCKEPCMLYLRCHIT